MGSWKHRKSERMRGLFAIVCFSVSARACLASAEDAFRLDKELMTYVDEIFSVDTFKIMPGVGIEAKDANASRPKTATDDDASGRRWRDDGDAEKREDVDDYFYRKWDQYTENHVVAVNMSETSRFFKFETGKSTFLAGFGMGFLAFALKKLLLPVFIGAQIVKSILIAMFLPSILGSLGKVVGKGLSTFLSNSGSSGGFSGGGGGGGAQTVEDFEFKDTSPYNNDDPSQDYVAENSLTINTISSTTAPEAMNRFGFGNQRVSYVNGLSDSYYIRQPNKKIDYKVFHKIPPSSLLLTTYDPFYSPLLSRLDSIFQQLGLGNVKSHETEKCRERLICMMYANPAKYAPYSNLVSAQLSRELNELRKPTSDNPEILRFFRYMKAAKDAQDGEECLAHGGCPSLSAQQASPAMLTTFNDINKLVQARKLQT